MTEDRYGMGGLGWAFLAAVFLVIVAAVAWYFLRPGAPPSETPPATPGVEQTNMLKVDPQSLAQWRRTAEPIAECEDLDLLDRLSRGAYAHAGFAYQTGAEDNGAEWSDVSISAFERMAELLPPGKGAPYRHISQLYVLRKEPEKALEYERSHLARLAEAGLTPDRMHLARRLADVGSCKEALAELRTLIAKGASDMRLIEAQILIGEVLTRQDLQDEALSAFSRAIALARHAMEQSTPEAFDKRGTRLLLPADHEGALPKIFQTNAPPDSARVKEYLAQGYVNTNEGARLARVAALVRLLNVAADRSAGALVAMGKSDEPPPGHTPAASQPARATDEDNPDSPDS